MLCEKMGKFSTKLVKILAYEKIDHDAIVREREEIAAKAKAIEDARRAKLGLEDDEA